MVALAVAVAIHFLTRLFHAAPARADGREFAMYLTSAMKG